MGKKKICFVVMGFGKKMDYINSQEVDMDIIYQKVIKELFEKEYKEYELIRADEISGSEIIDVSMYTLLIKADLVIADITTMNENALYELGARHALKPYSTIIMLRKSEKGSIPFDLNHNRMLMYNDFGKTLNKDEAIDIQSKLKSFINRPEPTKPDSPLYIYLPQVIPPKLDDEIYNEILNTAIENENTISSYIKRAEEYNKNDNFACASKEWERLHELIPRNNYVTQQWAFSRYKSKEPNVTMALEDALNIIKTLSPEQTLDLETLGITGAIHKRLYEINNNFDYLDEAIKMYRKGYIIKSDYYNGENYANCLMFKTLNEKLAPEEIAYLRFESKKIYQSVASDLEEKVADGEIEFWMYATLSVCYCCMENECLYKKYEELFYHNASAEWEKETYKHNIEKLKDCMMKR